MQFNGLGAGVGNATGYMGIDCEEGATVVFSGVDGSCVSFTAPNSNPLFLALSTGVMVPQTYTFKVVPGNVC